MQKLERDYKGWTIRLTPDGELCSEFAMVLLNPEGEEVKHVKAAGATEARAFERGQEMVDMELAIAGQQ